MQINNNPLTRRLVILAVLLITLAISLSWRPQDAVFALPDGPSVSPPLINADVLHNWLPAASYDHTLDQIYKFLRSDNTRPSYILVDGPISTSKGTYDFKLRLLPQQLTHKVSVAVVNTDTIISTSVSIDGVEQDLRVTSSSNGINFTGIDSLIEVGITSFHASELQQAFYKFAPTANSVAIDTNSIVSPPADPTNNSLTNVYSFKVDIDSKTYTAHIKCTGLDQLQLILSDSSGKQAFDSGVLSQS